MNQFTDKNSPGLLKELLGCITGRQNFSSRKKELLGQPVTSVSHNSALF